MSPDRVWVIGADPDCDVVVNLPTVSGRHCRLKESSGGFFLEDLQSTNGTYINGKQVTTPVRVTRTDIILLGSKVALPWPDLSAGAGARTAATARPEAASVSRSTERRQMIGAACGVGLAALLFLYAVVKNSSRKGDASPAATATNSIESVSRERTADGEAAAANQPDANEHPATSRPADVSPAKPASTSGPEAAIRAQERNVVWVGYRLREYAFPYASGWLARPDRVVTTAAVVADLEPLSNEGIEPIVWRDGQILRVKAQRRHPDFDADNPGSQASMHANVAVLELDEPLDASCIVASPDELAALSGAQSLLAVGFESELKENEPYDELKFKRLRHKAELVSSEVLASKSSRLYKLRIPTKPCWEGAPIFNDRGHVVGTAAAATGGARMVPVSQLSRLLEYGAGTQ
jgi:hypothetical protein